MSRGTGDDPPEAPGLNGFVTIDIPRTSEATPVVERHGWQIMKDWEVAVCPRCSFAMGIEHEDEGGGYTCPVCRTNNDDHNDAEVERASRSAEAPTTDEAMASAFLDRVFGSERPISSDQSDLVALFGEVRRATIEQCEAAAKAGIPWRGSADDPNEVSSLRDVLSRIVAAYDACASSDVPPNAMTVLLSTIVEAKDVLATPSEDRRESDPTLGLGSYEAQELKYAPGIRSELCAWLRDSGHAAAADAIEKRHGVKR